MPTLLEIAKEENYKSNVRRKDLFKHDKDQLLELSWAWANDDIGARQFCQTLKKNLNNSNYLYVIASVFKWAVQNKRIKLI